MSLVRPYAPVKGVCLKAYPRHGLPPAQRLLVTTSATSSRSELLALTQWAISNGIKYAKVRPEELEGDRGMMSTFDILPGEALVSVPPSAVLRTYPGDAPPPSLRPALTSSWTDLPWYIRLALIIATEQQQGIKSKFAVPLAALPSTVDIPAAWSPEEVQQLQIPHIVALVQQQQQDWQQWCSNLAPALKQAGISEENLLWALGLTRSRSFAAPYVQLPLSSLVPAVAALQAVVAAVAVATGPGAAAAAVEVVGLLAVAAVATSSFQKAQREEQHALCPLIDMFNHDSRVESVCQLDIWSGDFKVVASQPWSAGQQVFISYGSSSNDALLQLYGFVEPGNEADRYLLGGAARRLQELRLAAQGASGAEVELELYRDGIPASNAASLGQLLGSSYQPPAVSGTNPSSSSSSPLVSYAALPEALASAAAALIRQEQQQLGSSLEEDVQLLQDMGRRPVAEEELRQVGQQLQQRREELARLEEGLQRAEQEGAAAAGTAEVQGGLPTGEILSSSSSRSGEAGSAAASASVVAVASGPDADPGAAAAAASAAQEAVAAVGAVVAALQQQQRVLEAEVDCLRAGLQEVKAKAVQYRVARKELLQVVLKQLQE